MPKDIDNFALNRGLVLSILGCFFIAKRQNDYYAPLDVSGYKQITRAQIGLIHKYSSVNVTMSQFLPFFVVQKYRITNYTFVRLIDENEYTLHNEEYFGSLHWNFVNRLSWKRIGWSTLLLHCWSFNLGLPKVHGWRLISQNLDLLLTIYGETSMCGCNVWLNQSCMNVMIAEHWHDGTSMYYIGALVY